MYVVFIKLCESFDKYPSSELFEKASNDFIENLSLKNVQEILAETKGNLSIQFVKLLIEQKVKNNEIRYELIKKFCIHHIESSKTSNNKNITWQSLFRKYFMCIIDFKCFHACYLLREVKNDKILNDKEFIKNLEQIQYFENGFRLLTDKELIKLKVGDKIFVLGKSGDQLINTITKITDEHIQVDTRPNINFPLLILTFFPKFSRRMHIKRERMFDVKVGDTVYMTDIIKNRFKDWEQVIVTKIEGLIVHSNKGCQHINCIDTIKRIDC